MIWTPELANVVANDVNPTAIWYKSDPFIVPLTDIIYPLAIDLTGLMKGKHIYSCLLISHFLNSIQLIFILF